MPPMIKYPFRMSSVAIEIHLYGAAKWPRVPPSLVCSREKRLWKIRLLPQLQAALHPFFGGIPESGLQYHTPKARIFRIPRSRIYHWTVHTPLRKTSFQFQYMYMYFRLQHGGEARIYVWCGTHNSSSRGIYQEGVVELLGCKKFGSGSYLTPSPPSTPGLPNHSFAVISPRFASSRESRRSLAGP